MFVHKDLIMILQVRYDIKLEKKCHPKNEVENFMVLHAKSSARQPAFILSACGHLLFVSKQLLLRIPKVVCYESFPSTRMPNLSCVWTFPQASNTMQLLDLYIMPFFCFTVDIF